MSEQWYCPNCGPVSNVEFEDGDLYTVCAECRDNVDDEPPPFVIAMQERIAQLKRYNRQCVIITEQACSTITDLKERIAALEAIGEGDE